ncbi:MAG: choice-of-anchor tandem repeat GloVer-containing protein [Bryobacteraceae bacterium]
MNELGWSKKRRPCTVLLLCAATAIALPAQTFTTLVSFNGANGAAPSGAPLVQGADGNLYGTTSGGGVNGNGTIFKITPGGTLTTLYSFTGATDGSAPGALLQATDGNFYGTTSGGGANKNGTIFKITPGGTLATLYSFTGATDGSAPGALLQAIDGNFYGTTSGLGEFREFVGIEPTIFKITSVGVLTTLYRSDATDGSAPGALVQATDGNLYGTTSGVNIDGTIFKITPGGMLTTLYSFCRQGSIPYCPDGDGPGPLVQATDGNFYGTTLFGGAPNAGTIFSVTPKGTLTTLYSFTGGSDGLGPGALLQAADGSFYGTTSGGAGLYPYGTIFKFPPGGPATTLQSFDIADGDEPGALVQAADGSFYGTTQSGGAGCTSGGFCLGPGTMGTVFRLALASTTLPAISQSGGVVSGASFQPGVAPNSWITIFGTNLSSITDTWANAIVNGNLPTSLDDVRVSVGGEPAYISYISPTQINALAPDVGTGTVPVTVTNSIGTSSAVTAAVQTAQPAFFLWGNYAVATTQDYGLAVKNGTFPGVTTVPAKPGEVIILWGTGFGPTSPSAPEGVEVPSTTYNTASPVTVTVGGEPATVYGAALTPGCAGLYQVAIQIPSSLADGDYPVIAKVSGSQSSSTTLITVQD